MENQLVYKAYEHLRLWEPTKKIYLPEELLDKDSPLYPLFSYIYQKTWKLYQDLPLRRNGEKPILHPINTTLYLKKSKINDPISLSVALLHDYVEEEVDLYRWEHGIEPNKEGAIRLDQYESERFKELERDLLQFCIDHQLDGRVVYEILKTIRLLTRHKRHFYLRSISSIFNCPDKELKERAIHVKLADVMHNLQSIENFDEPTRLYVSFKALFVLNNAKKHLIDHYGREYLTGKKYCPMEKLFNKCARDTYDASLTICRLSCEKGTYHIRTLLQLAFKKFELLNKGLWEVTFVDENEIHPLRLYQGVVRKYDARLHHEFDRYDEMRAIEMQYCDNFFRDYHFNRGQLHAIVNYKDAFGLKEVIAYLIYQPDYVIARFLCEELSVRGRIKK